MPSFTLILGMCPITSHSHAPLGTAGFSTDGHWAGSHLGVCVAATGLPKFHSQWTAAWFFKSASEQELDYRMSSAWHKPWQRRRELPVPAWASSHTHSQFCFKATPTPALALQSPVHTSTFPPKLHPHQHCALQSPTHTNTAFQSPAHLPSSSNSSFQSSWQGSHFHTYLCTTCGSPSPHPHTMRWSEGHFSIKHKTHRD